MKIKTKYAETKHYPRVIKDVQITRELIESKVDLIAGHVETLINARIVQSQFGNIIQFCEDSNIQLPGLVFIKTQSGGYWIFEDEVKSDRK